MIPLDPSPYGPTVAQLLRDRRLPELGPGRPSQPAQSELLALTHASLAAGRPIRDPAMLDAAVRRLGESDHWDPFRFTDLCERVTHGKSLSDEICREMARIEWELLFDYCYWQGVDLPK